jgi:hypothetical protein
MRSCVPEYVRMGVNPYKLRKKRNLKVRNNQINNEPQSAEV